MSESTQRRGVLATLGGRLFDHASVFSIGSGLEIVLGLVRLAILTRLLEISIYGQLTLLVLFAGWVTVLVRVSIVTGTLISAFRGGGDEEGIDDDSAPQVDSKHGQRTVLGTGLLVSLMITATLVAVVGAFAGPIDEMLIDSGDGFLIVAATLLGGLNGCFRLVSSIPRFERKPRTYVVLQLLHTLLGLVAAVALIEAGFGLEGAIAGLTLGTILSFIPALIVSRHRFALRFGAEHVMALVRTGAPLIWITVGFWAFRSVDLFMISRYLSDVDVAVYRVAARIGGLTTSAVGGLILAWGPLMRGPMRGALHREGLLEEAGSRLFTYFWLVSLWIILALALLRDGLVLIAGPGYGDAAALMPLLGISGLLVSTLVVGYRTSMMRGKRRYFIVLAVAMPILLVGLAVVLMPRFGLDGAAATVIVPPLLAAAVFLWISERSDRPIGLSWAGLTRGTVIAAAWAAVWLPLTAAAGSLAVPLGLVATLAVPVAFVVGGALSRDEAMRFASLIRAPKLRDSIDPLELLGRQDLDLLDSLLRKGEGVESAARASGREVDEVLAHLVALLREIGEIGEPKPIDPKLGSYLLSGENVNLRDRKGHMLALEEGVSSLEVDELTTIATRVRELPQRRWDKIAGAESDAEEASEGEDGGAQEGASRS